MPRHLPHILCSSTRQNAKTSKKLKNDPLTILHAKSILHDQMERKETKKGQKKVRRSGIEPEASRNYVFRMATTKVTITPTALVGLCHFLM